MDNSQSATMQHKQSALMLLGYGFYSLPNGITAIADPHDNEDGYYLQLASKQKLVCEAYDHILGYI